MISMSTTTSVIIFFIHFLRGKKYIQPPGFSPNKTQNFLEILSVTLNLILFYVQTINYVTLKSRF